MLVKLEWLGYRTVKKTVTICWAVFIWYRNVTDGQTDGQNCYINIAKKTAKFCGSRLQVIGCMADAQRLGHLYGWYSSFIFTYFSVHNGAFHVGLSVLQIVGMNVVVGYEILLLQVSNCSSNNLKIFVTSSLFNFVDILVLLLAWADNVRIVHMFYLLLWAFVDVVRVSYVNVVTTFALLLICVCCWVVLQFT